MCDICDSGCFVFIRNIVERGDVKGGNEWDEKGMKGNREVFWSFGKFRQGVSVFEMVSCFSGMLENNWDHTLYVSLYVSYGSKLNSCNLSPNIYSTLPLESHWKSLEAITKWKFVSMWTKSSFHSFLKVTLQIWQKI